MTPHPYSSGSSLPADSSLDEAIPSAQGQILAEGSSPSSVSGATTPSPIPQEVIQIEQQVDTVDVQEINRTYNFNNAVPCYPSVGDIMPYDHSLPDFIRQITNQSNLANVHSLSLRVISTLISLHRMSTYLPNLRELDLEGSVLNSLRDIGCSLKKLHILKVGRCQLESLDGTFGLSSLRELYAQNNLITDVSPCSNLPHIRHIDVSGNRIRNISYAGFLSVCNKLKSIVFAGNPAAEVAEYRKNVQAILPQIESLDGEPFCSEECSTETERTENCCEGSDNEGSTEVPDFLCVSPTDSMNNLFEYEDDAFLIDKKNKHAINIANQDQLEVVDYEEENVFSKLNNDFPEDFNNLSINKKEVKRGLSELVKIIENKNTNIKQKYVSIQKLDKDIENRSKKSNLPLTASLSDELLSTPETVCEPSVLYNLDKGVINSGLNTRSKDVLPKNIESMESNLEEIIQEKNEIKRPSTTSGIITKPFSNDLPDGIKCGAIRKRPTTSVFNHTQSVLGNKEKNDSNFGISKLTSGSPICGNLTVALRNRKKLNDSWNDEQHNKSRNLLFLTDDEKKNKDQDLLIHLNGSGDNVNCDFATENEEDLFGKDVLVRSKRWREAFRRYRSNNRAQWEEEEDDSDYSKNLI